MQKPISNEELTRTIEAYREADNNASAAAKALGIPRSTMQSRVRAARAAGLMTSPNVEFPAFVGGDDDTPIEEILRRKSADFERTLSAANAKKWFTIRLNESKPYGLMLFGDPHIDDNGCNMPLLQRHIEVARRDGIYSVNIGDTTNNWVGRLMRLYADQDTSEKTAKRLAEWFMFDSGITWLCWVLGNHDLWNRGAEFHKRLGVDHVPVLDWHAQFKIAHPGGYELKVDAAHGRKGNSIWNNIHSTLRAAKLNEHADLFVTGHTHNYAMEDIEIAERGTSAWLVQLRGYKYMDSHALLHGFAEHQRGSSVLAVVDPRKNARTRVICFEDVEQGANYLEWLRK